MGFEISIGDLAFGAAVAFLFGVFGGSLEWSAMLMIAIVMTTAVVVAMTIRTGKRRLHVIQEFLIVAAAIVIALVGSFYFHFFVDRKAAAFDLPLGKEVSFRAIVRDEPKLSEKYLLLTAQAQPPFAGAVTMFVGPWTVFHYGDLIQVRGIIRPAEQSGADPAIFPQSSHLVASHRGFWLRERMIDFKEAIFQKFNDVLPADEAALLGGMTLGGTAGMSTTLKSQMERSGTSYLATMYGYKINVIIFGGVGLLGSVIARRKRFFLTLALLALFVAMTGAEASAVRAVIMGCVAISARELGRMPSMRNALALTAAGMTILDPTLIAQAGFLLSFLSLIGIVYLGPPLKILFGWHDDDRGVVQWKEAAIVSVSSLFPIIPILMATFGQFSATAFLSNILVFPAILPMMLFGYAIAITGFVSYHLAFLVARFSEILIWYEFGVMRLFSVVALPLPQIFTSTWSFVLYYAVIAWFMHHYGKKQIAK